jgi:hypothetical protein
MTHIDDLLSELRTEVPDPEPGAAERIATRVLASERDARVPRSRRPVRSWLRAPRLALAGAAGLALTAALALVPGGGGDPGMSGVVARAEAAVSSSQHILELAIRLERTSSDPGVPSESITMRQWTLMGAEQAVAMRVLISERPPDQPPTDEDSSLVRGTDGSVLDQRSWTPTGDGSGHLRVWRHPTHADAFVTVAEALRRAYSAGELKPAGKAEDGAMRLVGGGGALSGDTECAQSEVVLDPETFIPRRLEIVDLATASGSCDPAGSAVTRETWTITARKLPAKTPQDRQVLQVGDWPTR